MKRTLVATTKISYVPVYIYKVPRLIEDHHCSGRCHMSENRYEVELDAGVGGPTQNDTCLHELMHAIDHLWDLKLNETKVRQLATTLTQALVLMKRTKRVRTAAPKGKARSSRRGRRAR